MLAREYIEKLIKSGQQALNNLDNEATEIDIQKALGELDKVNHDLEAAQILLREEFKDRRRVSN